LARFLVVLFERLALAVALGGVRRFFAIIARLGSIGGVDRVRIDDLDGGIVPRRFAKTSIERACLRQW